MGAHVSWRAVLRRIYESGMAEDKNILTAAGKDNSWLLLENKELGLHTNLLGNSWRLLLGGSNLVGSCWGGEIETLQLGGKYL